MAITRTYAVGANSYARRLDNHTLPWVDINPPDLLGLPWNIYDVMADPNDPDKVTIVGDLFGPGTGILVSTDAGVNWNIPGGVWVNNKVFWEVWYVDSNIIWAVGDQGQVVKSTDGGLTFNSTANRPGDGLVFNTRAIHAIDDQIAVVAGSPLNDVFTIYVYKTIDGGFSWTTLNGGASLIGCSATGETGIPSGIHISDDQQTIVLGTGYQQFRSSNGGASFTCLPPSPERSGRHLTWFPSHDSNPPYFRHTGGPIYHLMNSLDNGATWLDLRNNEFIEILGAHFYSVNNGYYTAGSNIYTTTDGAVTGSLSLFGEEIFNAVWTQQSFEIYRLIDCSGNLDDIYSVEIFLEPYVGNVINIDSPFWPADTCWRVEVTVDPTVPITSIDNVINSFETCDECLPDPPDDKCWDLVSCNGACDDIPNNAGFDYQPFENQLVYLNGNTDCIYEVRAKRQAFFLDLRYAELSDPAGDFQLGLDNHTLEVTSIIFNGTEYVTSPVISYILTPTNYQPIECTGISCSAVAPNTTENGIDNTALYLDQVFTTLDLPLEAIGTGNDSCNFQTFLWPINFFKIQYRDGDTFSITLNVTNSSGTSTWVLYVNPGNVTIQDNRFIPQTSLLLCNSDVYCEPDNLATTFLTVDIWGEDCPVIPSPEVGEACDIVPRLGEVGFSWKNCDVKTVIKTKSQFADSVYALFKRMRYGIETCCEFDLDKIDVKNMLLDLGALYDPDLCIDAPVPVDCCLQPCDAIAQIFISQAVACPAPVNAIVDLTLDSEPQFICFPPNGPQGLPTATAVLFIL